MSYKQRLLRLRVELDRILDMDHYVGKENDIQVLELKIREEEDMDLIYKNNKNRKEEKQMAKHFADVLLEGVVQYARQNEGNKGGVNFYIVRVEETYTNKEGKEAVWNHNFIAKQFFKKEDRRKPELLVKDTLVKVKGDLRVESRKVNDTEYEDTVFILIDSIDTLK